MRISFSRTRHDSRRNVSGCGRVLGSLFFFAFLGMGLFFSVKLAGAVIAELKPFFWTTTECEILSSEVVTGGGSSPYAPRIRYRYELGSVAYESNRIWRSSDGFDSFGEASELVASYPAGAVVRCHVNEEMPREVVLRREIPWIGLFFFLPLIFVAVGAGGLWATWRKGGEVDEKGRSWVPKALSKQAGDRGKRFLSMVAFGGLFTLVGAGAFIWFGVVPVLGLISAQSWIETPCTIVSSEVRRHSGSDSTTYSIDILYEYVFDPSSSAGAEPGRDLEGEPWPAARAWRSSRFSFVSWSSSGYDGKRAVVDQYPPGSSSTCFVDPKDPSSAVLDRGFRAEYLVGLFPLIFLATGLAIIWWAIRQRRARAAAASPGLAAPGGAGGRSVAGALGLEPVPPGPGPGAASGGAVLEPTHSPVFKLLAAMGFCGLWNGIASVLLWQLVSDWREGSIEWTAVIFLTPMVLVGLVLIGAVVYFALALANPRPRLHLSSMAPGLGDTISLSWKIKGAARRLRRLVIVLEGREEATYRRGTSTHTDKEVFIRFGIVDSGRALEMESGSVSVVIPEDTMHSFAGESNKVVWAIKVRGDIRRWPDVRDEYIVPIQPGARL